MVYVAVSCPVFARFSSIGLFDPLKTTLMSVFRRFPCAGPSRGKTDVTTSKP
jgi:hypothetical protein